MKTSLVPERWRGPFASIVIGLIAAGPSQAAVRTWSGSSSIDMLWSDTNNWAANIRPVAGDDVLFSAGGLRPLNQNDLLTNLHSVTFGSGGYTILGNGLTLATGITATNTTGQNIWDAIISLGANQSFTNLNAGAELIFLGLDLKGKSATFRGAGTNLISNELADGAGGGSLTNFGTGVFLVAGTNVNFTGPMALNAGTNLFIGFQERSPITWNAGTLGGTGHVGNVTASGASARQLGPGYLGSTGILVTSNLVLNSAVSVVMHLNGTNQATFNQAGDYDRILTHGNITLGSASLNILFTNNFSPPIGTSFSLISPLSPGNIVAGAFANFPEGSTLTNNGVVYQLSYDFGHGVMLTVTDVLSTGVSRNWTGSGANNLWSNPSNWQNNVVPQQGDTIVFDVTTVVGGLSNSNDLPRETTFDSIHFLMWQNTTRNFTLVGNSFRLNSGVLLELLPVGILTFNGTYIFSNHITLNHSQAFTNSLDASLELAGGVELGPNKLSVGVRTNLAAVTRFNAPVTGNGVFSMDGGLGQVLLNASNSITGSIEVNNGTLTAVHPQALGSTNTGPVYIGANGALKLQPGGAAVVFTSSSLTLTGRLTSLLTTNATCSTPILVSGPNALIQNSNSSGAFILTGPITNNSAFSISQHSGLSRVHLPATALVQGAGLLRVTNDTSSVALYALNADGIIENTVQLGNLGSVVQLSGSGQINSILATNCTISPGSAFDPSLSYNPLNVGMLTMGGSFCYLDVSLFPNRPSGGPTNSMLILSNAPTLTNAYLRLTAQTNLAPNQQFTILRNLSSAPITNIFREANTGGMLPEGAFLKATEGNLGLQITYLGGAGHDVVLTVQSNTPPIVFNSQLTINEYSTLVYTNPITDYEPGETFIWTLLTTNIPGLSLNPTNGVLTWTPAEGQGNNTYEVLFKVTDSGTPPMSSTAEDVITVKEINLPPVPSPVPDTNVLAGHTLTIQFQATDPDLPPQPLTWSGVSLPANASVTTNGLFTYTPSQSVFATNIVTVKVCDSDPSAVNSTNLCSNLSFKVVVTRNRIVTNTIDNAGAGTNVPGSLRWAITELATNASGGHIEFNIPGTGPFKIAPTNQLPDLGANTYVDGYTQPGTQPNTNIIGTCANIMIELSGENIPGFNGLASANGVTIRGLCINRFTNGYPISVGSCCGTGNFCDHGGEAVEGCFFGTDTSGTNALPNTVGISISCTHGSRLGGPDVSQRNLISGNTSTAVFVTGHPSSLTIQNNLIGADRTGTNGLSNGGDGISTDSDGGMNDILIADNVIVANTGFGASADDTSNFYARNKIGVGADGATPLGNGAGGLNLNGTGHLVGGTNAADGNMIGYNKGVGVDVAGANITVLGNSIFRNGGRAIVLESGANNNQSAPVLTSATPGPGTLSLNGTLTSQSNTSYRIEFFHNPDFSPSNQPQGWIFLGTTNVTTDSNSNANFSITFNQAITTGFLTATATDPAGDTSGISDGLPFAELRIARVGSQVRLLWLTNLAAFILQSNGNLLNPNGWSNVPGTPSNDGQNFFQDVIGVGSARFFRLRSQ